MSYNTIYPPLGVTMSNHYQAIDIEEEKDSKLRLAKLREKQQEEIDYKLRVEKQRKESEEYQSRVAKQQEEAKERIRVREEKEKNKTCCERYEYEIQVTFCVVTLIVLGFIALYVFSILLGTIVIVSNYVFETTMVALYGRAIYNKNFPICSNDIYQGSDCYTRTSTYCT
jgi:Flp pilus assembly protein TadB